MSLILWILLILFFLWLIGAIGHNTGRVSVPGGNISLGGVLVVILIVVFVLLVLGKL